MPKKGLGIAGGRSLKPLPSLSKIFRINSSSNSNNVQAIHPSTIAMLGVMTPLYLDP
jgi:hypothetical protein